MFSSGSAHEIEANGSLFPSQQCIHQLPSTQTTTCPWEARALLSTWNDSEGPIALLVPGWDPSSIPPVHQGTKRVGKKISAHPVTVIGEMFTGLPAAQRIRKAWSKLVQVAGRQDENVRPHSLKQQEQYWLTGRAMRHSHGRANAVWRPVARQRGRRGAEAPQSVCPHRFLLVDGQHGSMKGTAPQGAVSYIDRLAKSMLMYPSNLPW